MELNFKPGDPQPQSSQSISIQLISEKFYKHLKVIINTISKIPKSLILITFN